MDLIGTTCAVLLAVVFAVSGTAKLLDLRGTREAAEALGVPLPLVGPVGWSLPVVELGLAVLLLPRSTGRVTAVGAGLLLLVLTGVVIANLLAGRRPRCGCFGGLGSSDVSGRTVARNLLLVLAAVLAVTDRGPLRPVPVLLGVVGAAAVIGGEQWLSRRADAAREQQQDAELEAALAEDAEHGPAPDFVLPDLNGIPVTRDGLLRAGRPLLLVALNPGCSSCRVLVPSLARWHAEYGDRVTVAAVARGTAERVREALGDTGGLELLLSSEAEELAGYGLTGAPSAALVTPGGRLAAPAAHGATAIRRLLAAALEVEEPVTGVPADELDLTSRPQPRPSVTAQTGDDGTVLVDETTGASLGLDRLGGLVWQCLDGRSRLDEIVRDLAEVFSADPDVVAQDVLQVVRSCGDAGLLVGVRARGGAVA